MNMLLKFNEEWARSSVNGALAIRKDINRIVDEICAQGYRNICWLGIGGNLGERYAGGGSYEGTIRNRNLGGKCFRVQYDGE